MYYGFYGIDPYFLMLVLPAILLSMWAQSRVSSTFSRYQKITSRSGISGAEIARRILDQNGLSDVGVERIAGNLTDHYDPRKRVVRLSQGVYDSRSVAALGVAAHETGHAVQHSQGYVPLRIRNVITPVSSFGARLSFPLILIGMLLGATNLIDIGIILFATVTVFQFVTLPVEYNASSRALATLSDGGILYDEELDAAKKVLSAAALTYLAALLTSAAQLLRLILLFGGRRGRR
jgi:Zn-dependent membrane protease YugP